jgi:hypothetical protein
MSIAIRFLVVMLTVAVVACMTPPGEESRSISQGELEDVVGLQPSSHDLEAAQFGDEVDDVSIAADCVFVEWCDSPQRNIGTVCRLRPGCPDNATNRAECRGDVKAVCGAPIQEFWICPQGASIPCG